MSAEILEPNETIYISTEYVPVEHHYFFGSSCGVNVPEALKQEKWEFLLTVDSASRKKISPKQAQRINARRKRTLKNLVGCSCFELDCYLKLFMSGIKIFFVFPEVNESGRIFNPIWFVGFFNNRGFFYQKKFT